MIHLAVTTCYILCEVRPRYIGMNGAPRKSALWDKYQRDSSYLPGRYYHGQTLEARSELPAQIRTTFDTRRLRCLRSRMARLAGLRRHARIARGLGDHAGRCALIAASAPAARRVQVGTPAHEGRARFDTQSAAPERVAGVDQRSAGRMTFRSIKSRATMKSPPHADVT